ncbi:putative Dipeptidyl peptidase 1 [Blattamonas nauphoetae]|uniref:Dipeptidyl peptidase 1 n=1 Tax=Blattamonas nauphoetae TaxID=2049346 RepID=A0ABQ9Y0J2_9EUKA|nr:putative Dipeptidyl peptidase 1 [Blattamonas nauphoetae]
MMILLIISILHCDTPARCEYDAILGNWTLSIGSYIDNTRRDCPNEDPIEVKETRVIELIKPNLVVDGKGKILGNWTQVCWEGVDIFIDDLHFFTFWKYEETEKGVFVTDCTQTMQGWVRENVVEPKQMACFTGMKVGKNAHQTEPRLIKTKMSESGKQLDRPLPPAPVASNRAHIAKLAKNLDWSNISGKSYTDPVLEQNACGSCYIHATLGALESRLLIESSGDVSALLSVQDVLSCSHYGQQCKGGWLPEVAGYLKDHGAVDAKCFPYENEVLPACSLSCDTPTRKFYPAYSSYVGGFYGNSSEEAMIAALQSGPIVVNIYYSLPSLLNYKSGIYVPTESPEEQNKTIDHCVVLVGYGEENGVPFWKIKNSFGQNWGENGYARIYRGNNTIQIESMAEVIYPLYTPQKKAATFLKLPEFWMMMISAGFVFLLLIVAVSLACAKRSQSSTKKDYQKF